MSLKIYFGILFFCLSYFSCAKENKKEIEGFVYHGKPIHPFALGPFLISSPESSEKNKVDLNRVNTKSALSIDQHSWITADRGAGEGSISYKAYFLDRNLYALSTVDYGGGSGVFTSILIIKLSDGEIEKVKEFGRGDRANQGTSIEKVESNFIYYTAAMTADAIVQLSEKNKVKIDKSRRGLATSPQDYFGCAEFRYQWKEDRHEFLQLNLLENRNLEVGLDYQECFNKIFGTYLEQGKISLNKDEVDKFVKDFKDTCVQNGLKVE